MSGPDLRCWQIVQLITRVAEVGLFALAGNPNHRPEGVARWHIASVPTELVDPNDRSWLARPDGLPSDSYLIEESARQLKALLHEFQPDIVVLDQIMMHAYEDIARSTGVPLILNTHNVEGDLARALTQSETVLAAKLLRKKFADRIEALENAMVSRASETWACSERDRQLFLTLNPAGPVRVVPNAIDVKRLEQAQPRHAELTGEGPHFLYCGLFHYTPNQRAAGFLIEHLYPALRAKFPGSRLILAGDGPTKSMLDAAAVNPSIIVTGRVPDIRPYLQHSTMLLAPIRDGGGTRFKLLEAFAAGLPVISTAKGAEGLEAVPGEHFLIAEDRDQFLEAVDWTLEKPAETQQRVAAARELVGRYSWDSAAETVATSFRELLGRT